MEARFKGVERQVFWLERKLSESGYIFDHEYSTRFGESPRVASMQRRENGLPRFGESPSEEDELRREYPFPWFGEPLSEARAPSREYGFQQFGETPDKTRKHRRDQEYGATALPLRDMVAAESRKPQREYDFSRFEEAQDKAERRQKRDRELGFLPFGETLDESRILDRDYQFPRASRELTRETKVHHHSHHHRQEQRYPQFGETVSETRVQQQEHRFPRLGETLRDVKMHHREHGFPRIGGITAMR